MWDVTINMLFPEKKTVFFFGAGISGDSGMPLGPALTWRWLEHHLPNGEMHNLQKFYESVGPMIGKTVPRLEKVIDDAIWTFGSDCLANLLSFANTPPNAVHHAIANYMVAHHAYVFTTNFDDAVENCHPGIPVMTPATGVTASWGVVKLHGSIHEDLTGLGHSIANLQRGLTPAFAELLSSLLNDAQTELVVLGYSGSDFFDIVPFFYEWQRNNGEFAASISWLHHHATMNADANWTDDDWENELSSGALNILKAFSPERKAGYAGPTRELLRNWLPVRESKLEGVDRDAWKTGWAQRFQPSGDDKAIYAAKLYASFGIGKESRRFLDQMRLVHDRFDKPHQLFMNALRDQGLYEAEFRLRQWTASVPSANYGNAFRERQMVAVCRLSGRYLQALWQYQTILKRYRSPVVLTEADDPHSALWSVAEAGLFAQSILVHLPLSRFAQALLGFLRLPLLLMIAKALHIYHSVEPGAAGKEDPHLVAMMRRLSGMQAGNNGPWINFALLRICKGDLPIFQFGNSSEDPYMETDSFLGIVNYQRNSALSRLADMVEWGWFLPKQTGDDKDWLKDAAWVMLTSLRLARRIGDPMGEIKALRELSKIHKWLGKKRRATIFSIFAEKASKRHQRRQKLAAEEVKAWLESYGPAAQFG